MSAKYHTLNRFFSRNVFHQLLFRDENAVEMMRKIVRRYCINTDSDVTNERVISCIYEYMGMVYRNEYFYKNTLLNKLLINVHRVNTTTALTEVAVARSKADFIMVNGKAVVYEIKTELDTFERLLSQISDYYKAFDHVCVVTSESQVASLNLLLRDFQLGKYVGVYVLKKNGRIDRRREPKSYKERLDANCMFKILNKSEYEAIVKQINGVLPMATPVRYYQACREILCNLPLDKLYQLFLVKLKERYRRKAISGIPSALNFLLYFSKSCEKEQQEFVNFLSLPFEWR